MARIDGKQAAQEHLISVAKSIVQAVYKAPHTTGRLKIQTEIITGDDLVPIIELLGAMAKINQFVHWDYTTLKEHYEAGCPPVLVLIGINAAVSDLAWNCGACGFKTCREFNAYAKENRGMGLIAGGPSCVWKILDAGIISDWAAATAWQHNVDNRVQGSTGGAAAMLGYLPGTSCILGLSLGPCKELVWYSREVMNKEFTYSDHINTMFRTVPIHFLAFAGSGKPVFKANDQWWADNYYLHCSVDEAADERMYEVVVEMSEIIDKYSDQIAAKYKK